jgi:TolA-binding protein
MGWVGAPKSGFVQPDGHPRSYKSSPHILDTSNKYDLPILSSNFLPSNMEQQLQGAQHQIGGLQNQIEGLQNQIQEVDYKAKEALGFHDRICNGEISNAAFTLLGHTSTSKLSKAEIYRRIHKHFPLVFAFAKQRNPDLKEQNFPREWRVNQLIAEGNLRPCLAERH